MSKTRTALLLEIKNLLWGYDEHVLDSDLDDLQHDIAGAVRAAYLDILAQAITDRQENNEKRAMALRMGQ